MRESRGNRQAVAPRPHARGRDPGNGHISNATVPRSERETVEPIRFEIAFKMRNQKGCDFRSDPFTFRMRLGVAFETRPRRPAREAMGGLKCRTKSHTPPGCCVFG